MSIEKIKELFHKYEDLLLEKEVLVDIAPEGMVGLCLDPSFGKDDGCEVIKVILTIEYFEKLLFVDVSNLERNWILTTCHFTFFNKLFGLFKTYI